MRKFLLFSAIATVTVGCGAGGADHRLYYITEAPDYQEDKEIEAQDISGIDIAIHLDMDED